MKTIEKTRFDTRLPKEQKEFFEYAARLGGYRTLTEFVISSVQEQANRIIEKYNTFLENKQDREVFFEAILNPQKPNNSLKNAASRYNEAISK